VPSSRPYVRRLLGRRAIQVAVALATVLTSLAVVAAPASAWPIIGW
jgi:hypothetical protein